MLKILIVDDENRTRLGLSALISKSDLPVKIIGTAVNGVEGLSMARKFLPDLIISDVRMPKMDGIDMVTEYKQEQPDCQIIFMSGYSDKEYLKSAIALKAVSYVEKPIDSTELLSAIKEAVSLIQQKEQHKFFVEHQEHILSKISMDLCSPKTDSSYAVQLRSVCPDFITQNCYCTLICQLKYHTEADSNTQDALKRLNHLFDVHPYFSVLFHSKGTNLFIIHIASHKLHLTAELHNIVNQFYDELCSGLCSFAEPFLAVGLPVSKPEKIYLSYMYAVVSLKKLFFTGYGNICYYQKHMDDQMALPFEPEASLFEEFYQTLRNNDFIQANEILTKLFHQARNRKFKFEINSIKDVYYQLINNLDTICQERGVTSILPHKGEFLWNIIAKQDTIFSLHNYITDALSRFADEVSIKSDTNSLVYRIKQYIDSNYKDPTLSINQMAKDLYFTTSYLCQVFKAETGTTINNYINQYRISKAKQLLRSKEARLFEISAEVGYNDPNYFTRQFKKLEGLTPTEFKEKYIV